MKKLYVLLFMACFISCNEDGPVSSGSDKTVIERSLTPSNTDINLTTSDGINITIPAGTLNSNLDIKIIKMANPPASTDSKLKVGSNVFKISLNGSLNFNDDIVIRIKYDKSKIQSGFTIQNGIKGILYSDNMWQVVDFEIDVMTEEIVFYFNPQNKLDKIKEELQNENSTIFGDSYTYSDSGNEDNEFMGRLKQFKFVYAEADASVQWSDGQKSYIFEGDGSGVNFSPYWLDLQEHPQTIVWTGNHIDVTAPYHYALTGSLYHIYGDFNSDGSIKEMTFEYQDKYGWSSKLVIQNVVWFNETPYIEYKIPVKNDTDRRKYVIDFRAAEPTSNGRTTTSIEWSTFNFFIRFSNYN